MTAAPVRRVRTPEGARLYGLPIGSLIVPDVPDAPDAPDAPDSDAPEEGEFERAADGTALRWRQAHRPLLEAAFHSLKGWYSDMSIHLADELDGAPQPSSGSGKKMRAQAAALLRELETAGRQPPRLYRGDSGKRPLSGLKAWSERRAVAAYWAKKAGGEVRVLEPGESGVRGLRVADYVTSQIDESEREWVIWHGPRAAADSDLPPSPAAPDADAVRAAVEALPPERDAAVAAAAQNAYDLGLREDAEDDGLAYWTEVLGQAQPLAVPVSDLYAAVSKESAFRIRKKKAAVKFYAVKKDGLSPEAAQARADEYERSALEEAVKVRAEDSVQAAEAEAEAQPAAAADSAGPPPPREVTFDAARMARFLAEVERLNKLAARMKVPLLEVEEVGRGTRKASASERGDLYEAEASAPDVETVTVRVSGTSPRLPGGWTYLGTVEHLKGGRLVHGDDKRLGAFRLKDPDCDYCHLGRDRKKVMVLVDEQGALTQVGTSCLKDFLGYHGDPEKVTLFADEAAAAVKDLEDEGGGGRYASPDAPTAVLLDVTAAVIRRYGWVPKSAVSYGGVSTADRVTDRLHPPARNAGNSAYLDELLALRVTDADGAKATAVRAWAAEQSYEDQYLGNLRTILAGPSVEVRRFGLAASAVGAYDRATGRAAERRAAAAAASASAHVGTVGQRTDFSALVTAIRSIESQYGSSRLVKLVDADGNVLKTFSSGAWAYDVSVGDRLTFKATVKAHDEYQGAKETNLTRVGNVTKAAVPEEKAAIRRVRTQAGVRRFGLPLGSPIYGDGPSELDAAVLRRAEAEEPEPDEVMSLRHALAAWAHWEPAKAIRMAAGELTGTYTDALSPQLYEDPDEAVRLYGAPPALDQDEEDAAKAAGYLQAESGARVLLEALASAPVREHELWRHVNVPLDGLTAFDLALTAGNGTVDLPLEAFGDSDTFVSRFDKTSVPEHPDYVPPSDEDDYGGWYADDETSVPPPSEAAMAREQRVREAHVPVLFRVLPGARALQGPANLYPFEEFVSGGRFEVVSDSAEPAPDGRSTRRVVTLRQAAVLLPDERSVPSVSDGPLAEFARLGLVDPELLGVDRSLIDFIEERSLSDPRLVQRLTSSPP